LGPREKKPSGWINFSMSDEMGANVIEVSTPKSIYSPEKLSQLDLNRIPKHVAIIMDGNRRWAKQRGLPPVMGHWEGAEVLTDVIRGASELGIKTLTVYAFSTENWGRPADEVENLMDIFELYLMRKKEYMIQDGVKLDAIGDLSKLPTRVIDAFNETKKETKNSNRINLVLALNYGARDEIRRTIVKILDEKIPREQITEECIGRYLDTAPFGDPELLIRTSGEMRVSNFLLWQISYAEIVSAEMLWPDFSPQKLLEALIIYQKRSRRLGTV
jgi:undecaprenyl diphosphate synthase